MSRADKITIEAKKVEWYSDFLNNFDKNPVTGYLARITNEESVKQSIRNLILTNRGERFYSPVTGSTVKHSLFNNIDITTLMSIKESITESINNFEPRAQLFDVTVTPYENENSVYVQIIFGIKRYEGQTYALELIIKRWR